MSELRERVLSFERELQQSIDKARKLELDITQLGNSRRDFIEGVCQGGTELELTSQRVKISMFTIRVVEVN